FHARCDFYKHAKIGDLGNRSVAFRARTILLRSFDERVFGQLLDTEREFLSFGVDLENLGLDFIALLEEVAGVTNAVGPADVTDVNQAVNAVFDAHEYAEVSDVADLAADNVTDTVFLLHDFPRIRLDLLH